MVLEGDRNLSILQEKEVLPVGEHELIIERGEDLHLKGELVPFNTFVPEALLKEWDKADLTGDLGRAGEILAQVRGLAVERGLDIGLRRATVYAFKP